MAHEVGALLRGEEAHGGGDQVDDLVKGAGPRGPEERLQLGEGEFNRIEFGTVRRQEADAGARLGNRGLHGGLLVHRQVVEDDHITGAERGDEDLLDVGEKGRLVDRAIKDGGRVEPVPAQRGDDGVGLPMAVRCVVAETIAPETAPITPKQIRGDSRFVEEDILAGIAQPESVLPATPRRRDISAPLFVGEDRFF